MSTKDPDPGFASRWSRLKHQARDEPAVEPAPTEAEAAVPAEDGRTDQEILKELGLPDPDDLKPGDDIKGFLAKTVPARLRNRALRRLWLSNPVLANLDELVEYGEDYTDAATVIENLTTAYQVGRGWADKIIETPKPPARAETAESDAEGLTGENRLADPESPPESSVGTAAQSSPAPGGSGDPESGGQDSLADFRAEARANTLAANPPQPISRKRMRFRIAED